MRVNVVTLFFWLGLGSYVVKMTCCNFGGKINFCSLLDVQPFQWFDARNVCYVECLVSVYWTRNFNETTKCDLFGSSSWDRESMMILTVSRIDEMSFKEKRVILVCADVAVSKCVEVEVAESVALGVVLQCLVEL